MNAVIVLIFMRLLAACICAAGGIWLAYEGKEGWGWMVFAAVVLGSLTIRDGKAEDE